FLREMPAAYAAADLVLSRGGASTLAEIAAAGRPAVVVPYAHHADRHQFRNAERLGAAARIVEEADLGPRTVEELAPLLRDRAALERMGRVALAAARPAAADAAVSELLSLVPSFPFAVRAHAAETLS